MPILVSQFTGTATRKAADRKYAQECHLNTTVSVGNFPQECSSLADVLELVQEITLRERSAELTKAAMKTCLDRVTCVVHPEVVFGGWPDRAAWGAGALALSLAAGSIAPATAAEGSSLRGLQPPRMALDLESTQERWSDPLLQLDSSSYLPDDNVSRLYGLRDPGSDPGRIRYTFRESWNAQAEGTATPALFPRYSLSSQAVKALPSGWDIGLGLRHKEYGRLNASVMAVGAQHQWGPLRGGYTLSSGYSETSAAAPAHRLQLMYDYGNHSTVGLSYTAGRELQAGITPLGLTPMEVRDLTLSGSHWLAPQWALTYNVTNSEMNSFRRQGLRLGIRHTF